MNSKYLYLNARDEFYRVDISKVVYFEADGNYTNFVLCNKLKGVVGMNLAQMQKVLSDSLKEEASNFARIGKRHIVNLNYVFHIAALKQKLTLSDGDTFAFQLPVSKDALKKLKDLYLLAITGAKPISELMKGKDGEASPKAAKHHKTAKPAEPIEPAAAESKQ